VTGELCYQLVASSGGSSCGTGLSMQAKLDGVFAWNDQNASFAVRGGKVAGDSLSLDGLTGHLTLNYIVLRGQNSDINADPPVLKIPFAFEFPVCPGAHPAQSGSRRRLLATTERSSRPPAGPDLGRSGHART
jgi:hypothetical protein